MGISMGGYGALLLAEKNPHLINAVAAISPAVFTSYSDAMGVNTRAYASAADFESGDVVTHAQSLAHIPVRIASGVSDPFYPAVVSVADVLPKSATVEFAGGCHDDQFFVEQEPPSMKFLSQELNRSRFT
jgi:S-formylglutathione hydrolase FrmB